MFTNITVIGLGIIGSSFCRAVKHVMPNTHITGIDQDELIQEVEKTDLVDRALPASMLAEGCRSADLIVLATPIQAALDLLPEIARHSSENAVVTDVCSLKAQIVSQAQTLFSGKNGWFIGGHPMAGSEFSGFAHADPFLFQNAIYVLCPAAGVPEQSVRKLAGLVHAIGAHGVLVQPDEHDRIAAAVSHLPQMLAVALMRYLALKNEHNPLYLKMAAGGFRDMTRIASSPFTIWRDICDGNREKISIELDGLIDVLTDLRQQLNEGNLEHAFEEAARTRLSIPRDTRGFLTNHFDVTVVVEDKPGIIARIASPLAEAGINIKDIQVLKVRENEGGTLRLSFESEEKRMQALAVLRESGLKCEKK